MRKPFLSKFITASRRSFTIRGSAISYYTTYTNHYTNAGEYR